VGRTRTWQVVLVGREMFWSRMPWSYERWRLFIYAVLFFQRAFHGFHSCHFVVAFASSIRLGRQTE
jgi:hypothetical protein